MMTSLYSLIEMLNRVNVFFKQGIVFDFNITISEIN